MLLKKKNSALLDLASAFFFSSTVVGNGKGENGSLELYLYIVFQFLECKEMLFLN